MQVKQITVWFQVQSQIKMQVKQIFHIKISLSIQGQNQKFNFAEAEGRKVFPVM